MLPSTLQTRLGLRQQSAQSRGVSRTVRKGPPGTHTLMEERFIAANRGEHFSHGNREKLRFEFQTDSIEGPVAASGLFTR